MRFYLGCVVCAVMQGPQRNTRVFLVFLSLFVDTFLLIFFLSSVHDFLLHFFLIGSSGSNLVLGPCCTIFSSVHLSVDQFLACFSQSVSICNPPPFPLSHSHTHSTAQMLFTNQQILFLNLSSTYSLSTSHPHTHSHIRFLESAL